MARRSVGAGDMSQAIRKVEYDRPQGAVCSVGQAWARVPDAPSAQERLALKERIRGLLKREKAVLVAHYYVDAELQELADETGGCVADSLEMARFGRDHDAQTLVVAGVRFMGETAKILSPNKRILMPDLDATCSLDLGCPVDEFSAFCDAHPDRTDRKSTRLNSSHVKISYAVFCLKKNNEINEWKS